MLISEATNSSLIVAFFDVLSGLAVIGVALLLQPLFKKTSKSTTTIYVALKSIEGLLMILVGILFLSEPYQFARVWIYENVHLYIFIAGGFIFYWLFYKSKLIPRFISVWGFVAIFSLFLTTSLKLLQINYPTQLDFLLILIITNEVFLAVWLMVKGFNEKPQS